MLDTLTAYNQITLPPFMYGTAWKKDATTQLVELAIASGFRAIDTANQLIHYQEAMVGDAIKKLETEGINRESLFLQTKFTPANGQDHRMPYDPAASLTAQVQQSFESSLAHLQTEYVDSYVLHGPYSRYGLGQADWEVWKAIEEIYYSGKAKIIGVSNVTEKQLTQLCDEAKVKPMVVQNRCYAVLGWDKEVRQICKTHGIVYQGFSLLTANMEVYHHPDLSTIAQRFNIGPAQVIFRFAQQIGMLPLTGTRNETHMKEDLHIDQVQLSPDELGHIEMIAV